MTKVTIFSDGSCLGNPGVGGWAFKLICGEHTLTKSGASEQTTNNQMELCAAIFALETLKFSCEVELYTDSQYVERGINEWLAAWVKRGFRNVKNPELWRRLAVQLARHNVRAFWVKAHAGQAQNEECDTLARGEATRLQERLAGETGLWG